MSSDALVEQANAWAKMLIHGESRGPGDLDNAMRRVGRKYGIPYSALWRLRYRKPKDIWASVYVKLQAAYLAACERQKRKLAHETAISKALLGPDDPVVLQAEAYLQADMEAD